MPVITWITRRLAHVSPADDFRSHHYLRHNQRRQEHLATLGLPIAGRSVLEVGAGIGDHTSFFIDRGCAITITEPRETNLTVLTRRFPDRPVRYLDLDSPDPTFAERFDIVYCYGVLYHLARPADALAYLARLCEDLLLVETCVTPGAEVALNPETEDRRRPSQSLAGLGCRPTRPWVMEELSRHFDYAYTTTTQPWHEEFPLDWSQTNEAGRLTRAVFVGSHRALETPVLSEGLPMMQVRTS